jgi:phage portal protein BeeE
MEQTMNKQSMQMMNAYGTKSITFDQYPDEAWDFLSGDPDGNAESVQKMWASVPWLYQGINIISQSCAEIPLALYRGETEITSSEDWKDPTGYMPDIGKLMRKISASIVLEGQGYLFRDQAKTIRATKRLIFWNPTTVKVNWELTTRDRIVFDRRVNGKYETYADDQVMYFWLDDGYTELGPPASSPAKAALAAAGVLYNADEYISAYWKRGAVKATMLAIKGNLVPGEADKLKHWWSSITGGVKKAFQVFTFNADSVTPTVIGEGLAGLENTALTNEKREDISTALGVPQSILFSTNAGGLGGAGVVSGDRVNLYELTVIPLVRLIVGVLNEQQLKDTGYRLVVNENEMAMYQEDEAARAQSLSAMITALGSPEEFLLAADIIGFEIDDETRAKVVALIAGKQERAAVVREQMKPSETVTEPMAEPMAEDDTEDIPEPAKYIDDLNRWRRKALKAGGDVSFTSVLIPADIMSAIRLALKDAHTPEEIKAAFVSEDKPDAIDPILQLAEAIKAASLAVVSE